MTASLVQFPGPVFLSILLVQWKAIDGSVGVSFQVQSAGVV